MLQTFAPLKKYHIYYENHIILNMHVILHPDDLGEILSLCEQIASQFPAWSSVVKHAFLKTSKKLLLKFIVTSSSKVLSTS